MDLKRAKMIQARVWPHNHTDEFGGPLDVKIGVTSQPAALKGWDRKNKPLICLEQPQVAASNFTILRVLFLRDGSPPDTGANSPFHQANSWGLQELPVPNLDVPDDQIEAYAETWKRLRPTHLTIYIKGRYANSMPHPIPRGKWTGTVIDDEAGRWVLFTLQAVTLAVHRQEKKRSILTPGDPEFNLEYKPLDPPRDHS
jgi:hypothetical protein